MISNPARWRQRVPIVVRITVVATAVIVAALLATSMLFRAALRSAQYDALDESARSRLAQTIEMVESQPTPAKLVSPRDSPLMVQILDTEGKVLCSTQNVGDMVAMAELPELVPGRTSTSTSSVDGADARIFARLALAVDGSAQTVVVAAPVEQVHRSDAVLGRQLWRFGPLAALLSGLAVYVATRRALRPVDRLRADVDALSASDPSARVGRTEANDEIGRLARTMNALLERLDAARTRQNRFVSDAAHELRSPLASSRTRLEVALRRGTATDWPDIAGAVLRDQLRMERLANDLLFLARADADIPRAVGVPVDLEDVALQEIESARTFSAVTISASGVSAARVLGHPDHLRRVFANLLDNAQRHAKSIVEVRVRQTNGEAVIEVIDDGPGVAAGDRERVFERFTRLDDARARRDGGTGLGLPIVREIVVDHGGRIELDGAPGGGTVARIRLPLHNA